MREPLICCLIPSSSSSFTFILTNSLFESLTCPHSFTPPSPFTLLLLSCSCCSMPNHSWTWLPRLDPIDSLTILLIPSSIASRLPTLWPKRKRGLSDCRLGGTVAWTDLISTALVLIEECLFIFLMWAHSKGNSGWYQKSFSKFSFSWSELRENAGTEAGVQSRHQWHQICIY